MDHSHQLRVPCNEGFFWMLISILIFYHACYTPEGYLFITLSCLIPEPHPTSEDLAIVWRMHGSDIPPRRNGAMSRSSVPNFEWKYEQYILRRYFV